MPSKQNKAKTNIDTEGLKRRLDAAEAKIKEGRDQLESLKSDIEDKLEAANIALESIEEAKLKVEEAKDKISELM